MPSIAVACCLVLVPCFAYAQQLTSHEVGAGAAASLARRSFAGAELAYALRPSGESRIALAVAGGSVAGRAAARAQLTIQLLVNASARSGTGIYAGVGAAFVARRTSPGQGYLAILLGLEGRPGRRQGWYVEAGLSGGVRLAAGWRLRWFPAWWAGR